MTLAHADQPYPFFSYPEVRDVRDRNTVFSAVAAFAIQNFGLEANGTTRPVWGAEVSGQYFAVVGIKPFLGRLLQRTDDDHPGASDAAVLSWPTWKSDFGADPKIVGKTIRLNKHPYTIVGVTPQGFYGTEKIGQLDIFVSMTNQSYFDGVNWLESTARSACLFNRTDQGRRRHAPGANGPERDCRQCRPAVSERRRKTIVESDASWSHGRLFWRARSRFSGRCAAVIWDSPARCLRQPGRPIRSAHGSPHPRNRYPLGYRSEPLAHRPPVACRSDLSPFWGRLCLFALGMDRSRWFSDQWHPPTEYPASFHVAPQLSLIPTALLISLIAGVVFGAMPVRQIFKAIQMSPSRVAEFKPSQQDATGRCAISCWPHKSHFAASPSRLPSVSLRGLCKALNMDLGIQPKHAVVAKFELSQAGYSSDSAKALQRQLLDRVLQLPGVQTAGYASTTPLSLNVSASPVFSQQATDFSHSKRAFHSYDYGISPGFLSAAGTPLLAGRDVSFADTATTPPVAVVNQQFARHLLQSDNALGQYFKNSSGVSIQIVGLVADGKYFSLTERQQEVAFSDLAT